MIFQNLSLYGTVLRTDMHALILPELFETGAGKADHPNDSIVDESPQVQTCQVSETSECRH
jgi:hypothetical protein